MALAMDSELEIEGETMIPDALVLEAREDEVWLMPNGDFKSVKIGENPSRSLKIGIKLSLEERTTLIECL